MIKAEDVARFLGKRVPLGQDTPLQTHLGRRHAGLRLKHSLGPLSVKLHNQPGGILRLEVTTYNVSFFRHYRQVEHRDGTKTNEVAGMKKSLYSLRDLAAVMRAGLARHSQWLATLVEHSASRAEVEQLGQPARDEQGRSARGFNLFLPADVAALITVLRGEYALGELTHRRLREVLPLLGLRSGIRKNSEGRNPNPPTADAEAGALVPPAVAAGFGLRIWTFGPLSDFGESDFGCGVPRARWSRQDAPGAATGELLPLVVRRNLRPSRSM